MVKKLDKNAIRTAYCCMPVTVDRDEAINAKLKLLQGRIFGKPIVKFKVGATRNVLIPYSYIVYNLTPTRSKLLGAQNKNADRKICVVFDINEKHAMQYDVYESGELEMVNKNFNNEWEIIDTDLSKDEILEKVEDYINFNIVKRFYGGKAEIKFVSKKDFYRPAVEIDVIYRKNNLNKRYAYLDGFGIQSEHILGLKYRVEHKG